MCVHPHSFIWCFACRFSRYHDKAEIAYSACDPQLVAGHHLFQEGQGQALTDLCELSGGADIKMPAPHKLDMSATCQTCLHKDIHVNVLWALVVVCLFTDILLLLYWPGDIA